MITVTPAPHRLVRKPDGAPLAADGERVDLNSYWQRRIDDGDVVVIPADQPKKGK